MKMKKRFLAMLLAVLLCMSLTGLNVSAAGTVSSDVAANVFVYADDVNGAQVLLKVIPMETLTAMSHGQDEKTNYYGSFLDNYPTPTYVEGVGVTLPELMEYVQEQTSVSGADALTWQGSDKFYFYASDGATKNYTASALFDTARYYFGGLYDNWDPEETAVLNVDSVFAGGVPAVVYLATASSGGRALSYAGIAPSGGENLADAIAANNGVVTGCLSGQTLDTSNALRLVIPQSEDELRNATATYSNILKWVYKIRLKDVTSPITSLGTVTDPVIQYSLSGTTLTVTMSCETPGASIYYSTIGGLTQAPVNKYTGPIVLENYDSDSPFNLSAIAVQEGYASSAAVTKNTAEAVDETALAFTYGLTADKPSVEEGDTLTLTVSLAGSEDFTLYGGEYRIILPAGLTATAAEGLNGWSGAVGGNTATFVYLNTAGTTHTAAAQAIGTVTVTAAQEGSYTLAADTAILTKENGTAYGSVSSSGAAVAVTAAAGVTLGDLNGDGKVNVADCLIIERYRAGLITLTEEQKAAADVNGDGKINVADGLLLEKYRAGLISSFQ